ncbi:H-type small acid-soluble spore protein [Aquisalibacillus elongatus]|uniref:Small, acid-soluble spore protein H n=1 Tax=Aquisalibacillus elongatus TaxID=485577 RepID=A0A3N5B1L9_9BACI|nr:H-type small acid-soluble spore protein [Aquisalibacillus elongatus]RPF51049.1 small acid-soluble spore protein H (minor) [Aquisalibacillus elongatus]
MDRLRAEEIASSPKICNVQYNGKRVFIQHVQESSDVARVYYLDDPTNEFEVQLSNIREKH